jgi:hypothetical protein
MTAAEKVCNSAFSLVSPAHLNNDLERPRNHSGVLNGPACCRCFLAARDEFSLNGAHQQTRNSKGKATKKKAIPKAVRVLHKPCKGKKGCAFFDLAPACGGKKTTADNLRISEPY